VNGITDFSLDWKPDNGLASQYADDVRNGLHKLSILSLTYF